MEIKVKNYNPMLYLQEGGTMEAPTEQGAPMEGGAPAPEEMPAGGEDPTAQLMAACQQALETQDCNLAMQVLQAIMQMIGGGGGAPAEPETAPVYRRGGILSRRIPRR